MNIDKLEIDRISKNSLSKISRACRYYRFGKHNEPLKLLIKDLLDEDLPNQIICIIKFIEDHIYKSSYSSENQVYIHNDKNIKLMTVKEGIDSLILYVGLLKKREENLIKRKRDKEERRIQKKKEKEAIIIRKKLKSFFLFSTNGIKLNWNKSEKEICEEIKFDSGFKLEITKIKREMVKEWFSSVNLDIPSDEQADVIANLNNSLKVVARAGSGKTRTIAQKILFLIHYIGYSKDQVLALVFNNKAMQELKERVHRFEELSNLPLKGSFKILTFDSLAFNLVKPKETPSEGNSQKRLIQDLIINALDNEENLRDQVEKILLNSFKGDIEKSLKLEKISTKSDLIRLRSFITEETIDMKSVKSKGEKRIADFFFEHDIPYLYEYPFTTDEGDIIRPDFYIPKPHNIIIEYCGLKGDKDYERILNFKRDYWRIRNEKEHEEDKFIVLEINPEFICKTNSNFDDSREADYKNLIDILQKNINTPEREIKFKKLTDDEIILKIRSKLEFRFTQLLLSAITRASQLNISNEDLIQRINEYDTEDENERTFLNLIPKFISMYKNRLKNDNLTDYDEIKKNAIIKIKNGKTIFDWDSGKNGIDLRKIKYIFVDEFQDFSQLFKGLLLAILKVAPNALVNAVGDDWQMINRFAGSNPELYDEFEVTYPKPKTLYLTTNYRSSAKIVEFCNEIMASNGVKGEPAKAFTDNLNKDYLISKIYRDAINLLPREEYLFRGDSILSSLFRIYKPFTKKFPIDNRKIEDKICFAISRTNDPPIKVRPRELGIRADNSRKLINGTIIKWTGEYSNFFEAITSHSSKGLEAEVVIIVQPKQFPLINKKSLFLQFFGDTPENLFRDELNLFYVACSRAKNSIIFLTETEYMMSPFLEKIKDKITLQNWPTYPCSLKTPLDLHTIKVTSSEGNNRGLFQAKDILKAFGFVYSCPNKIPTRSIRLRKSPLETLLFLQRLLISSKKFNLKYGVFDGLNKEVFAFPGKESLEESISKLS